jgi:glyoxylase-like metal-dependent hydrolase (beta-lactamase superfamily II)
VKISPSIHLVGSEQFGLSHPLDCNCYLLDGGSALALVDAGLGLGAADILENIDASGFDPRKLTHILITHSHIGHWGGASRIREQTGAEIWIHEAGMQTISDIESDPAISINRKFGRYPAGFEPSPCRPDRALAGGQSLQVGHLEVRVMHTMGHTPDSVCFLVEEGGRRALFTGDVVFYAGKLGLLNLDGCSLSDYRREFPKLAGLNIDMLLPGHGVFVLRRGQRHIERAIHKLSDFVMPETFFEDNEFVWARDYLRVMGE